MIKAVLSSNNHLCNYLIRIKSLRLRLKRCRSSYIVSNSKTIITLFVIGVCRRESKRCRPNLTACDICLWSKLGDIWAVKILALI